MVLTGHLYLEVIDI
jgi:hypothetical protein